MWFVITFFLGWKHIEQLAQTTYPASFMLKAGLELWSLVGRNSACDNPWEFDDGQMCCFIYKTECQGQSIVLLVYNSHSAQQNHFPSSLSITRLWWIAQGSTLSGKNWLSGLMLLISLSWSSTMQSALQGAPFEAYLETANYLELTVSWFLAAALITRPNCSQSLW